MDRATVVVIGGGVAGASLAYHLTLLGLTDVLLVEKDELTSGSTWHSAGLCTQYNPSFNLTKLLMYSVELYQRLEEETGHPVDYHRVGSVRLATSPDRLDEFRHRQAMSRVLGLPLELVGPEELSELCAVVGTDGVLAAAYLPTDGHVDPNGLTQALAQGARNRGARIQRRTRVERIDRRGDAWRLETSAGIVECEIVVNAAGQHAREVGELVGVRLPIVSMQHQYVITEELDELEALPRELPVFRDPERSFYLRQERHALLVGPFERNPLPWALDGIPPDFSQQLLAPNLSQIEEALAAATERVPLLLEAGIKTVVNGPDGYTPDGRCLMGEVPGLPNYHVLAGFSIFGIVFAGGAGKYAAEWIVAGQPSDNMWELDVRRFGPYTDATRYMVAKASDVYEREYAIHYPHEERPPARPLKTSALYDALQARGAVYGERFGWERPLWFAPPDVSPEDDLTFRRPKWLAHVAREARAVREHVGVLDQTSFAKFEVRGPGARAFLDYLCANTLPTEIGRISLTQILTRRGGIECDVTVTMVADDRYYVVSAAATEAHDLAWLTRHRPDGNSVEIENLTARYGVLTVAGPRSRDLLSGLTTSDLSNEGFPFFRARELEIGLVPVRALRLSYVGELGWELHHPLEYQRALYESLLDAGAEQGLVDFGYRTLEALRLEKGYRLWGSDISADYTPFEAGLGRFVKLDKGNFIGRDALLEQAERGAQAVLTCLVVDTPDGLPHGYEPVYADDRLVAYVMSGGYGPVVDAAIAYAYLPREHAVPGTELSVEIVGERRPAVVTQEPLYDPDNRRLRT